MNNKILYISIIIMLLLAVSSYIFYVSKNNFPIKHDDVRTKNVSVVQSTTTEQSTSTVQDPTFQDQTFTDIDIVGKWNASYSANTFELQIDPKTMKHIYKDYDTSGKVTCVGVWSLQDHMISYQCANPDTKKTNILPFAISLAVSYDKVSKELTIQDEGSVSIWKRK